MSCTSGHVPPSKGVTNMGNGVKGIIKLFNQMSTNVQGKEFQEMKGVETRPDAVMKKLRFEVRFSYILLHKGKGPS